MQWQGQNLSWQGGNEVYGACAMNCFHVPVCAAVCLAWMPCAADAQRTYYSKPELANESVGLLETEFRDGDYRGSATVARDGRILYSCAHMVYDSGVWAQDYTFHRAWHGQQFPAKSLGLSPRGFHYFSAYVKAARYTQGESNASFANDFIVFYGPQSFGPACRVKEYSGSALRTTRLKRIIGYPSHIDFTGARGYCYQHSTGWFPNRAQRIRDEYYDFSGVSTGSGNSGGGIFLRDSLTGEDVLAGVLVSGGYRSAGVVAMDSDTRSLAQRAIGSAPTSWSVANASPISTGAAGGILVRSLPVQGAVGSLESIVLDLDLSGIQGSAPIVFLQSPSGRTQRMAVSEPKQGKIRIRGQDRGAVFRGPSAQGAWSVRIHANSSLTFQRACLRGISAD